MKNSFPHIHKKILIPTVIAGLLFASTVVAEMDGRPPEQISFQLMYEGEVREVTLEDLGVSASKSDSGLASLIGPDYTFTWDQSYNEYLLRDLWDLSVPEDAQFVFVDGLLSIEPEEEGVQLDVGALLGDIASDYPRFGSYDVETTDSYLIRASYLEPYFDQVNRLLTEGLMVHVGGEDFAFPAQQKDFAIFRTTLQDGSIESQLRLSEPYLNYVVTALGELFNQEKLDMRIVGVENPDEVNYVTLAGTLQNGRQILEEETEEAIQAAFEEGAVDVEAVYEILYGEVLDETGLDLGDFELLGSGQTLFARSAWGRAHNIRKALNDHFNGLLIPPGAEFSFNDFLGPIDGGYGWANSTVIYKGELEEQLGGGICQASTTVYRAALDAGLEITEQRGHSLYVLYYQEYGDGLDATVYPGDQNLKFINNTPGYLLMRAYTDGDDAFVELWGTNDGRTTTLEGPYTSKNQTDEVIEALGEPLRYYQIAWKYTIVWGDGTVEEEWIVSSYKSRVEQNYEVGIL